jgi:hypothetical protein
MGFIDAGQTGAVGLPSLRKFCIKLTSKRTSLLISITPSPPPLLMKAPIQVGTIFGSIPLVPPHKNSDDTNDAAERRSEARKGERIPVQFYDGTGQLGYQGTLINGSDGGAFIETNKTLPLLTKLRIEGPGITCQAIVCRVHWLGPEERASRSGGMAVRLISRKEHELGTLLPFSQVKAAK